MDRLLQDLRFAFRGLRTRPLFAVVAAGSLAIGIGANTALFSAVNALLLRSLPGIPNVERAVELGRGRNGSGFDTFALPELRDIGALVPALAATAAYTWGDLSVARDGEGVRASGVWTDPSYFEVMGLEPARGRFFTPAENAGSGEAVAVLSWRFWQDRLGGDPDVVGSTVRLNREPHTVVGVAPEQFRGHEFGLQADVWLPLSRSVESVRSGDLRSSSWARGVGLLADGATLEELNAQLAGMSTRLAEAYPETNTNRTFAAMELGPVPAPGRGAVRLFLGVLMGLVALVLLVTCANVAGMFLARAASRQREVAVRLALGAGRGALVRHLTVEALLVFVIGGGLGWLVAIWTTGLLRPELIPLPVPIAFDLSPDLRVAAFAGAATLATGLLFGLLPALQATRLDLVSALRQDARGAAGGRRGLRLRRAFVGAQVGLSLVLLVAAGLFLRSLQRAATIDSGFDATNAYLTGVDLSIEGYDVETGRVFHQRLLDDLRGRPWVEAAALANDLPLDLSSHGTVAVPEAWPADAPEPGLRVEFNRVSPGYFETLGIPVLAGRGFLATDLEGSESVALVSRTFAERAWPGENALGRTFAFGSLDPERGETYRVVGVAEDVKNQMITDAPVPFVYTPLAQDYASVIQIVVRAPGGLTQVAPALRAAVLDVDPRLSLQAVVELERYTSIGVLPQRVAAGLTSALGLLALLLSGLGVYGVVAYTVGTQTREIGIRMALGADRGRVLARVLRGGLWLALPGLAIGALFALAVTRVMGSLLLGLSPFDPVALGGVALALSAVVGLATWLPARRAVSVEPAVALRGE